MAYIVWTSNLDLVSFIYVPALYSTLKFKDLFVSSFFVLSNVTVEDIVGLYTCIRQLYCLTTSCDTVVKTLSLCQIQCVSVHPLLSYINLNIPIVFCRGTTDCLQTYCGGGVVYKLQGVWYKNTFWR